MCAGFTAIFDNNTQPDTYGTSCSTPTVAGIISLLNDQRKGMGKPPLGFINPFLYQNARAFNDITTGNNPGCSTDGFYAAEGWDPVTGLGSPDFRKLAAAVEELP
jgi:tripeptidyl-peptidase-1